MPETDWNIRPTSFADDSSNLNPPQQREGASARSEDEDLLDAYSRAVMHAVDLVIPAVISVSAETTRGESGQGSGFIVSPDGIAITNSHVVSGRNRVTALSTEGDRLGCEVIGDDPSTDLAVLRLTGRDLPHVTLGDSDALRAGQLVIALGSPLGLHSTVSTGVVSGVGRNMRASNGRLIENIVQHAAPINPGNSGGPLIDSRGRVVGVNTAIIAFAQGIGFAVPSKTVKWIISEVLEHGRVRRRQLGIVGTTVLLPRSLVVELDLIAETAVRVMDVDARGLAALHGIVAEDLIVAVNDRIIANVDDLHRFLSKLTPETSLELTIVRDGRLRRIAW